MAYPLTVSKNGENNACQLTVSKNGENNGVLTDSK